MSGRERRILMDLISIVVERISDVPHHLAAASRNPSGGI